MKRKYRRVFMFFIVLLIACVMALLMLKFFHNLKQNTKKVNVIDSLENYDYKLEDRDTVLYKNLYNELKMVLKEEKIDKNKYAEVISKLFIVDLFTLDNKLSKYDVGGTDFVYEDSRDNYKLDVEETLYKTIKNNADGKRRQDLPIVKEINLENLEEGKFKLGDNEVASLETILSWTYEKDYGYDKKAKVTLVEKDDKLYIVEYSVEE